MKFLGLLLGSILTMGVALPDLIPIQVPNQMTLYHSRGPVVSYVVCNRALAKPLIKALQCLERLERPVGLVYHGCYNYRNIAGTNRLSKHAAGMAIDLNAGMKIPDRMVKCFEDAGFTWGGRWGPPSTDPMHWQIDKETPHG
jgi:hypothetical protein